MTPGLFSPETPRALGGSFSPTRQRMIENAVAVKTTAYAEARRQVTVLGRAIQKTFTSVDLLITPTLPTPPGANRSRRTRLR